MSNNTLIPTKLRRKMLEILRERIRHEKDFPALAESVVTINRIVSSEWESIASLSNAILKDFALTSKLLKVVNSAAFAPYGGGNISTVSRAVAILGFDGVRGIALTLILLDHLESQSDAAHLRNEFLHALFAGTVARAVSERTFARCAEEAFVCAMFHNLGRLLAMFYLPEEEAQIRRLMAEKELDEEAAAEQVLGVGLRELGRELAGDWHFPPSIMHSMEALPPGPLQVPEANQDRLRMLAVFADELCMAVAHTPCQEMAAQIRRIEERFADGLPLTGDDLAEAVERAMDDVVEYANIIGLDLQTIPFGRRISQPLADPDGTPHNVRGCATATRREEDELQTLPSDSHADAALLTAGLEDISTALVDDNPLHDALHIILETLYRGLGFRRVLLAISDGGQTPLRGRFGFGSNVDAALKRFHFEQGSSDLFQVAVARGLDVVIADADDPQVHSRLPRWYRDCCAAPTFALFPLQIGGIAVGLIYADKAQAGTIRFSETESKLVRTLRNQAVLALKQYLAGQAERK